MRTGAKVTAAVVAFVVGMILMWGAIYAWRWIVAEPEGKLEAREKIQSGDNRIAAYDHFYNECASVQALEVNIEQQQKQYDKSVDPEERNRLSTNLTGLNAYRAAVVAQYNADARKSYTIGQFRASDLPYQLPIEWSVGDRRTSCVASR